MNKSNFDFLKEHDNVFFQLASSAETIFSADPNTTLIKLRQLGEAFAQDISARCGIEFDERTTQVDLLYKLNRGIDLDASIMDLFHILRIEGNKATHQFQTHHREAIKGLRVARTLAVWFHQSFGKNGTKFKPDPFITPKDPSLKLQSFRNEIDQLKSQLIETNVQLETNKKLTDLIKKEKEEYEELAEQMDEEARVYEQIAIEHEQSLDKQKKEFEGRIRALIGKQDNQSITIKQIRAQTHKASSNFSLNEELTRIIIDQKLNEAGWQTDTQEQTYRNGSRPEKGKNKAIAEWPTVGGQSADYILFAGLIPIAVVEAKRENTNVAGKIHQAERYSVGFRSSEPMEPAWTIQGKTTPWFYKDSNHYKIPFVYSCNGRPYIKQMAEQSGTWFRDVRDRSNLKRPIHDFHTPEGLLDKLKRSRKSAEEKLKQEGFDYLKLRDYQIKAIQAVELALQNDQRYCLLAMATGTGKTRTIIGLMYRFLKSERFKRILFLVDRRALGLQANDVFNDVTLEQNQPLSKIYNIAQLGDMATEAETRIQVATVQAMVHRIFISDNPPNVDTFDCIIVDEAHRGYTLDQDMTEGEILFRNQAQYLSSYRRVLDYFDASLIGLTATPAKHTTQIFGKPVYVYSYREAVADDWLIDHEPPISYKTLLSKEGIKFEKDETVNVINSKTGIVESVELDDELNFDIDSFNKQVITEPFNEVICDQLSSELDPFGEEKTMIFCATDRHADMVKRLLDKAFKSVYQSAYNEASVRKITGTSDQVDKLIRQYKNERYPTIAITVDLLTTGIDVHKICHLVFLRRVKSRILYEQMIGRATRRCDEIGKTVFKIYDPVDIYSKLQDISTMKPLVKDPKITIDQLIEELMNPQSKVTPGQEEDLTHAHDVLNTLNQKIMRVFRKAAKKAETEPQIKNKLDELEELWGVEPHKLHQHFKKIGPNKTSDFIKIHNTLSKQINAVKNLLGTEYYPVISEHEDHILERVQSYGEFEKPEDYLEGFQDFILRNINQSVALSVVVNKPKNLTREQLKEVRLLLDTHGYSEANLKSAWRSQTNQEIAASIIGYIRQAALNEPLIPFAQRVSTAMEKIYAQHTWTPVQRKWLERLSKQLVHEVIIDQDFINRAFAHDGGIKTLNTILGKKLKNVLNTLTNSLWDLAG